jgi:hypothetical protein
MWINPEKGSKNTDGRSKMVSPGMDFVVRPPQFSPRHIIDNVAENTGIPDAPLEAEIAQRSS